jgi:hypothetical protein
MIHHLPKSLLFLPLIACEPLVIPIDVDMSVAFDATMLAGLDLGDDGYAFSQGSGVQDIEAFRAYVPAGLRDTASFELGTLRIGQPQLCSEATAGDPTTRACEPAGSLEQWMDSLAVYITDDGVFDEDEILLGKLDAEDFAKEWVELPIDLVLEGSVGVFVVGHLVEVPSAKFELPMQASATATVDVSLNNFF